VTLQPPLQEAATVNDRRRSGIDKAQVETITYVVDRQKALGRFRTLPWGAGFEAERQAMGKSIESLWKAWDDPHDEFQRSYDQARAAVSEFTAAIGAHIMRHSARN